MKKEFLQRKGQKTGFVHPETVNRAQQFQMGQDFPCVIRRTRASVQQPQKSSCRTEIAARPGTRSVQYQPETFASIFASNSGMSLLKS